MISECRYNVLRKLRVSTLRGKLSQSISQGLLFGVMLYLHSKRYRLAVGGTHPCKHSSLQPPGSHSRSAPRSCGPLSRSHDLQETRRQEGDGPEERRSATFRPCYRKLLFEIPSKGFYRKLRIEYCAIRSNIFNVFLAHFA